MVLCHILFNNNDFILILEKNAIRSAYKEIRNLISIHRKIEIKERIVEELLPLLEPYKTILSYSALLDEVDLSQINLLLSEKLLLPKIDGDRLIPIYAHNQELSKGEFGILQPSKGAICESPECVLVPGIAFDERYHRFGFVKGYYDRFLKELPRECKMIGIAFKEQKTPFLLPVEPHDIQLDLVLYF